MTSLISYAADRWARSGYLAKTAAVIYAAPIAVWGVCAAESLLSCALSTLYTGVAFNSTSRAERWEQTKKQATILKATGIGTGASLFPIYGTYQSYNAIFEMAVNHVKNTWQMRDLQQRANTHAADTLYDELLAAEPDIDRLIDYGTKQAAPTLEQRNTTEKNLKPTLVPLSWTYSFIFHAVDGTCRALRIVAIKIGRVISALFAGHLLRAIVRGIQVMGSAVNEEIQYTRNLVNQPNRSNVPEGAVRNLYRDEVFSVLSKCPTEVAREWIRLGFTHQNHQYRQYATTNELTRVSTDAPLPENAPDNYLHILRELPKAIGAYAKVKIMVQGLDPATYKKRLHGYVPTSQDDATCRYILDYFRTVLPCLNRFKLEWTTGKTGEAKLNLLWAMATQLPNLREISLDMQGVDPRWQMLIGVQLARHSPKLHTVTLINADPRVARVMNRFVGWFCRING